MNRILDNLNISSLNEMQEEVFASVKNHSNIVLLSPTGSGKTVAFLYPFVNQLKNNHRVQMLIIAPSRELAIQIESVVKCMKLGVKSLCCYGGHSKEIERNSLTEPPSILVGTPGRINDWVSSGVLDLQHIHNLVVDEYDKLIEMGFSKDLENIFNHLSSVEKKIFVSATKNQEFPEYLEMQDRFEIDYLFETNQRLETYQVISEGVDKLEALSSLLSYIGNNPILIFCNHRDAVERIGQHLNRRDIPCNIFHGAMEQFDREKSLIQFRNGSSKILICTDLASRGLDIPELHAIVHYQLPTNEASFIHRNGRTARMFSQGKAFIVRAENESIPEFINEASFPLFTIPKSSLKNSTSWITLYIGGGKKHKISRGDILGVLCKQAKLSPQSIGRIDVLDKSSFVAIRKKDLDLIRRIRNVKIKKNRVKIEICR